MRQDDLKKLTEAHLLTGILHRRHKRLFARVGLQLMRHAHAGQPGAIGQLGLDIR